MLSEAKHLNVFEKILRCAQNDEKPLDMAAFNMCQSLQQPHHSCAVVAGRDPSLRVGMTDNRIGMTKNRST
jgi:hypothetical protein